MNNYARKAVSFPKIDIKMKISFFFLFLALFKVNANTYSQSTKVTLDFKNVTLNKVFSEIKMKTEFKIFYMNSEIDLNRKITIKVNKKRIGKVLDILFAETDVVYDIVGKQIVLRIDSKMKIVKSTSSIQIDNKLDNLQSSVSGTIRDENGAPIPGVNIVEEGTTNGTQTDFDGYYTISVSEGSVLVFSYLGMKTKTVTVGSSSILDVSMEEDTSQLDEVVVTALGIKKDAKALGYSVAKVDNSRIMASGTPANALQALYGTASGVRVAATASGPAGGMKINIRNAISFDSNSSTRPLIVVDGIPIHDENTGIGTAGRSGRDNGTGINDINPDDIASFDILKGAKASVLYGSEGANGVILITTKSGSKNTGLGVSLSMTTTLDTAAFLADLQNEYGTGRSPSSPDTDDQGYYLNDEGERTLDIAGSGFGPKYDPSVQLNWWDGSKRAWAPNSKSIYKQLFRTGSQTTTNLALTAGGEKGSMRFSYTNTRLKSISPGGNYDKNTFSLSSKYEINDHVTLKYSGNYYATENQNAHYAGSFDSQGSVSGLGAYSSDIDVDLLKQYLITNDGYNYFANPDNTSNVISSGRSAVANTLWDWTQNESNFKRIHNIQSLTLDIEFNDFLGLTILGGLDNTNENTEYKGKLRDPSQIGPNSGSVYRDVSRIIRKSYGQALFNFNANATKDINVSGFVGGVIRHHFEEKKGAERLGGFVIPNFFSFSNLPSGQQPSYINDNQEDMLYSVLGSLQVDWKNQVYLEAQARNDWSSILPVQNNSYFYPGLSATWILSSSFNLPTQVKFLKLRTSWADVGRPGSRYFSNVNLGVSQSGSGFILSPPSDLPPIDDNFVPNLKPERKREFEVGLEAYFFENRRLGVDFAVYHSNTYDQIMKITAPPGLGVNSIRLNAGDVSNTGWELALKTKPIDLKDFKWNLDFTFSGTKTKVVKLDGELKNLSLWSTNGLNAVAEVGGEYGAIYQQKGFKKYINPSDENDPNNGKPIVANSGQRYRYYSDSNKKVGKVLPDLIGGVFTSFNYKNFTLVANLDYTFGATFISEQETYMMASGVLKESLKYRDQANGGVAYHVVGAGVLVQGADPSGGGATFNDGVVLDGVLADGTVNTQVVRAEDYYRSSYFSNGFFPEDRLFKSDYIALRNIALSYSFSKDLTEKMGVNGLSLSLFCNNVAYLYKAAPNTIPESSNGTGWSSANYGTTALPSQRSMGLSIKAKF
ncbi:MAG: SusC/RagA family TonB-linked outer membrane protein [Cellulophaga sp.]